MTDKKTYIAIDLKSFYADDNCTHFAINAWNCAMNTSEQWELTRYPGVLYEYIEAGSHENEEVKPLDCTGFCWHYDGGDLNRYDHHCSS